MPTPQCPDDIDNPICREITAQVAKEIEGATFTQSYRLDAIIEPLIGNAIRIPGAYTAKIPLGSGAIGTRLYLTLYDVAEYILYHVIYSGSKRVDKDEVYFKKEARHHVSAVKLGPKSCDLLSYGKIEAEENKQVDRKVRAYWLIGQAFNRPVICNSQLCGPTASYLRILDERDGTFHTYSIAIANMSPHIIDEPIELPLPQPLRYTRYRIYRAHARLITYDPATGRLEPVALQLAYMHACMLTGVTPGPHLLLYGPALEDHIVAVPLRCTCAGAPTRYCSRSLYYHASILVLALLIREKKSARTVYIKLARKAYKIMEPGEAGHLSYSTILKTLAKELGEGYKIIGTPLRELARNPRIVWHYGLRKGEKLLQKALEGNCRIVL